MPRTTSNGRSASDPGLGRKKWGGTISTPLLGRNNPTTSSGHGCVARAAPPDANVHTWPRHTFFINRPCRHAAATPPTSHHVRSSQHVRGNLRSKYALADRKSGRSNSDPDCQAHRHAHLLRGGRSPRVPRPPRPLAAAGRRGRWPPPAAPAPAQQMCVAMSVANGVGITPPHFGIVIEGIMTPPATPPRVGYSACGPRSLARRRCGGRLDSIIKYCHSHVRILAYRGAARAAHPCPEILVCVMRPSNGADLSPTSTGMRVCAWGVYGVVSVCVVCRVRVHVCISMCLCVVCCVLCVVCVVSVCVGWSWHWPMLVPP